VILRDRPNAVARVQDIIRATAPLAKPVALDLTRNVREQLTTAIVGAVAGAGIAAIALLLTAVGTLGVFRYIVIERISEIGVRKALGATGRDVILLVLRGIRTPIVIGVVVGLIGAQTLGMFLDRSLYGISARDPLAYGAVFAVLTAVIVLALVGPARKAVRVDPASMLRAE
jgi:ABC-type antimicrobial peptide transport system permease subunit